MSEADEAKKKLSDKPDITGIWQPESFFDETPLDNNLYKPVLNRWIREIKRQTVPVIPDNALDESLKNAREKLLEIEQEIVIEDDKDTRQDLEDEADEIRKDITELERTWNNHPLALAYLNTAQGALWLQSMIDSGNGDIYTKKALSIAT